MSNRARPAPWVLPLAVAIIAFLAFLPALNARFVSWDDDKNFLENFSYRGLGPAQLEWMWSTFHLGHYVPLSWMTLGFDYLLWGMNPRGYHLTNLLLHSGAAVMLYAAARRILARAVDRAAGGVQRSGAPAKGRSGGLAVDYAAAVAALLFAVHPLRVESVAWITERRDLLSGLLYFTAVYAYLRAADDATHSRRWYAGAIVATIGAMLAKASAVTLPAALLILELYPLRRLGGAPTSTHAGGWRGAQARAVYARVLPFAIVAAGVSAMAFIALQAEPQLAVPAKVAVSAYSLMFYVSKTLAPFNLSPLYAMPERVNPATPIFLFALATVVCVSAAAFAVRRRWPGAAFAWLAFAVVLFPLLGVHQNGPQIAADRYTYNAAPALALLAAALFHQFYSRAAKPALAAAGAVIAALCFLTWRQTLVWQDSRTLWSRVLSVEPNSPLARNNVGNLLMRDGRVVEATAHYRAAVAAKPDYAEAHDNLGVALAAADRPGDAIKQYQRALDIQPSFDAPQNNWGVALARQGNLEGAIEHFRLAIIANPANSDAHVNWGNAAVRVGRTDEAIAHYEDALRHRPDNADAHHNWGVALARRGKFADAARHFEDALAIHPDHAQARDYLARVRVSAAVP